MPSWKTAQSKKQTAKKVRFALIILTAFISFLIFIQIFKFAQSFFSPWKTSSTKNYSWDGNFNINLVIRSKTISLLTFSPKNQKISIINIPDNTFMEAMEYGRWQAASVYQLGQTQNIDGDMLLSKALRDFLGIPVDGYLDFSGKLASITPAEIIEQNRANILSFIYELSSLKTNLTPFELLRLQLGLSSVRFDKKTEINLEKYLQETTLADGSLVYTGDPGQIDSVFTESNDPQLSVEHKTIAIFNSTDHPQLAQKAARMVTNIGGDVIIVSNSNEKLAKTKIAGEKSRTLDRLRQIFNANGTIDPNLIGSSRAQINLFVGEDFNK